MHRILRDLAGLSSGTLATLTGTTRYDELEELRSRCLAWTLRRLIYDPHALDGATWRDAWHHYREAAKAASTPPTTESTPCPR
jgi:hypothetical protein